MKTFIAHRTIKEMDLDLSGHMNNAKYLSMLEDVRWDFITESGFGVKKMQQEGIAPTILEINIKFLNELCLRDEVTIETQVISYQGKIGKIQQRIMKNDVVCSIAEFTIGLFDTKTRKLISPTAEWLAAVGVGDITDIKH